MLKHLFRAIPLALLGVFAVTGSAMAAFDPTSDELSIGAFVVAVCLMVFLALVYGAVDVLGINKPEEVDIPDHAHDHRYAGHH
jgi:Na+/H+-dicarboxylate symporter